MVATGLRRQLDGEELEFVEGTLCRDLGLVERDDPTREWKLSAMSEVCAGVLFCAASEVRR
ncbi:MAG: hypothetical protein IAG13_37565 [Deltaproteobacteria bacterium]|nr:hypothetical protein [Nannocystaceae bacterium]